MNSADTLAVLTVVFVVTHSLCALYWYKIGKTRGRMEQLRENIYSMSSLFNMNVHRTKDTEQNGVPRVSDEEAF